MIAVPVPEHHEFLYPLKFKNYQDTVTQFVSSCKSTSRICLLEIGCQDCCTL